MRVAVVHDYLTQRGGAERVVLAMLGAFPGARLVTSVYDAAATYPGFRAHRVETTWLDRVPAFRRDPRRALPLLAPAFSALRVEGADAVLCSSSGWAHGVRVPAGTRKVVYCYTPARWLHVPEDYLPGQPAAARAALAVLRRPLLAWDRRAAASADAYLTSSTVVRDRIRRAYGIEADVVPPPVTLSADGPRHPVAGVEPGYFLAVGRARGYKNVELLAAAFAGLPRHRLLVVGSLPDGPHPPNVSCVSGVTDAELRWLYAGAAAVLAVAFEDFGLTPLEGNLFGRPALALRAGGFLDTVAEGVSGAHVAAPAVDAVRAAVEAFDPAAYDTAAVTAHAARYSPERFSTNLRRAVLGEGTPR